MVRYFSFAPLARVSFFATLRLGMIDNNLRLLVAKVTDPSVAKEAHPFARAFGVFAVSWMVG